jgi:serine O-acetyltransferase
MVATVLDRIVVRGVLGTEIPVSVFLGAGLGLPHGARGLIVHPDAHIGENCMLFHRVTLAANDRGAPHLENDVLVGVGACVIGPVTIAAYAQIGANATIVKDVPGWTIVHSQPVITRLRGGIEDPSP